jgi:hypothetical protein
VEGGWVAKGGRVGLSWVRAALRLVVRELIMAVVGRVGGVVG